MNALQTWSLILAMGLVTYGMRLGSLVLADRLPLWPWLRSFLRYVPVAVLSAIISLGVLAPAGQVEISPRLLAAAAAVGVAVAWRKVLPSILAGMVVLWLLKWLL